MRTYDVIIVGAGASGLAAASRLKQAKRQLLILEARNRIGGRIFDVSATVALGAEFIHGQASTTRRILRQGRVPTLKVSPAFAIRRGKATTVHRQFWRYLVAGLRRLEARDKRSFASALRRANLDAEVKSALTAFVTGFHAANPWLVSAKAVASETDPKAYRTGRIKGGYTRLLAKLRPKGVRIGFGNEVTNVNWASDEILVTVKAARGTKVYRCRKLVVTLPLSLLKAGEVKFRPKLKEKQAALRRLNAGHVHRFVLRFRRPFWSEHTSFFMDFNADVPTWWQVPGSKNILVGWCGGPRARALSKLSPKLRLSKCLQSLSRIFDIPSHELRKNLVQHWNHDWENDPYSRGAYSYSAVGGKDSVAELAKPLGGKLFFAGEATDISVGDSTVESAIRSGYRAAAEVKKALT